MTSPDSDQGAASTAVLQWIADRRAGCTFAAWQADRPLERGWQALDVERETDDETIAALWEQVVRAGGPVAQLTFPYVTDEQGLIALIRQLARLPGMRGEIIEIEQEHKPQVVCVGLRWTLPDSGSEARLLGFAPFASMPPTRRAPHVAVVFKADAGQQPFLKRHPSPVSGLDPIDLADLPVEDAMTVAKYGKLWKGTHNLRQRTLNGELTYAAKAKVTFSLPTDFEPELTAALQ